jgi:chemotaxis protein methyltransferase CheR
VTLTATTFDYVRELVRRESAIVLASGKEYLVEARLSPLARQAGLETVDIFVDQLRSGGDQNSRAQVVEAMTTNETSWYRDGDPFNALRTVVLPEVMSRSLPGSPIRVWSAACSSGQEPYTVAMEMLDTVNVRGFRSEILATDLSEKMVERTNIGRYSQLEVNRGLPVARLVEHFARQGTEWVINPRLQEMVSARRMNLDAAFPALGKFDIVFLRNVLIYFDVATKRKVLQRVRAVMGAESYLFLGSAEVTIGVDDRWVRNSFGRCSFYRPLTGA